MPGATSLDQTCIMITNLTRSSVRACTYTSPNYSKSLPSAYTTFPTLTSKSYDLKSSACYYSNRKDILFSFLYAQLYLWQRVLVQVATKVIFIGTFAFVTNFVILGIKNEAHFAIYVTFAIPLLDNRMPIKLTSSKTTLYIDDHLFYNISHL